MASNSFDDFSAENDVENFLHSIDLGYAIPAFREHNISFMHLVHIKDDKYLSLFFKLQAHKAIFLEAVSKLDIPIESTPPNSVELRSIAPRKNKRHHGQIANFPVNYTIPVLEPWMEELLEQKGSWSLAQKRTLAKLYFNDLVKCFTCELPKNFADFVLKPLVTKYPHMKCEYGYSPCIELKNHILKLYRDMRKQNKKDGTITCKDCLENELMGVKRYGKRKQLFITSTQSSARAENIEFSKANEVEMNEVEEATVVNTDDFSAENNSEYVNIVSLESASNPQSYTVTVRPSKKKVHGKVVNKIEFPKGSRSETLQQYINERPFLREEKGVSVWSNVK
ncbi:hypothetical protein B4U80_14268 [Leptotrombidium deliense]|uniref:Uncharacterized protein n=1 Tax=Leptotrombidium deliense TaxID=299467 RepID=A0A443RYN8_9ACAR|nr:hypothetical protein B4U80_14268 [Leptotrombidium deliense]